jgi:hypothetical protein
MIFFKADREKMKELEITSATLTLMMSRIVAELVKQDNELRMLRRAVFGDIQEANDQEFWDLVANIEATQNGGSNVNT